MKKQPLELEPAQRAALSVPEFAALLGLSRSMAYSLVESGRIRSLWVGRRILVPRAAIDDLVAEAK